MAKVSISFLLIFITLNLLAQDTTRQKTAKTYHNFIINLVPNQYNKPLIGVANFAKGNHKGLQFSLFNWNQNNFNGTVVGVLNIAGGELEGGQIGVINIGADSLHGVQLGFINVAKTRKGTQIGIINYSDTVTDGLAIGILSIIRKGYQAFELGISENYPYNISYKIGLKNLYNSVNLSFKDFEYPVFGFGFGSLVSFTDRVFINPDFTLQNGILKSKQGRMSLAVKMSYAITNKIHISAGPSAVWRYTRSGASLEKPFYVLYDYSLNPKNILALGFRCSLRYNFKGA